MGTDEDAQIHCRTEAKQLHIVGVQMNTNRNGGDDTRNCAELKLGKWKIVYVEDRKLGIKSNAIYNNIPNGLVKTQNTPLQFLDMLYTISKLYYFSF